MQQPFRRTGRAHVLRTLARSAMSAVGSVTRVDLLEQRTFLAAAGIDVDSFTDAGRLSCAAARHLPNVSSARRLTFSAAALRSHLPSLERSAPTQLTLPTRAAKRCASA